MDEKILKPNEPTTIDGPTILYGAKAVITLPSGNFVWFPPFIGAIQCHCCDTREKPLIDARGPGIRPTGERFFLCAMCTQEFIVELARGYMMMEHAAHEVAHASPG